MRADKSVSRPEAEQYLLKQRERQWRDICLQSVRTQGAVDQGWMMCDSGAKNLGLKNGSLPLSVAEEIQTN